MTVPQEYPISLNSLKDVQSPPRHAIPACESAYIGGDYLAMSQLAGDIFRFAYGSNSEVKSVAHSIETMMADGGNWSGDAARVFKYAFGADVIMMSGMSHVANAVGQLIDKLAFDLATLEKQIEARINQLNGAGYLQFSPGSFQGDDGLIELGRNISAFSPRVLSERGVQGARTVNGDYIRSVGQFMMDAGNKAKALKKDMLSKLTSINGELVKTLDAYKPGGHLLGKEHGGILSDAQLKSDEAGNARLRAQFDAANKKSGITGGDVKTAYNQLKKIGGDAATVADLISQYKQFGSLSTASRIATISGTIEAIGPVVGDTLLVGAAIA